jgi:hypothetical protein
VYASRTPPASPHRQREFIKKNAHHLHAVIHSQSQKKHKKNQKKHKKKIDTACMHSYIASPVDKKKNTHRLHAVIDSQSRRHFATRGVNVQDYGLAEILKS